MCSNIILMLEIITKIRIPFTLVQKMQHKKESPLTRSMHNFEILPFFSDITWNKC